MSSDRSSEAYDQETHGTREDQQPLSANKYHTYKYTNEFFIHISYQILYITRSIRQEKI